MTATPAYATSQRLPDSLANSIVHRWQEPILILDKQLRITFANQSFCEWACVPWFAVEHRSLEQFLSHSQVLDFVRGVQHGSTVRELYTSCEVPGVGSRMLLLLANTLETPHQHSICLGIVDVTDQNLSNSPLTRKEGAAEKLELSQRSEAELLRSMMESSGDGIVIADANGRCVLWNPACERMLGMAPDLIEHKQWAEQIGVYLPDQVTPYPVENLPLSRALRGESCTEVELWIKNKVSDGLWISATARPLGVGQGGAVATFRDVTVAKGLSTRLAEMAAENMRSNRELEQFAYVAAHDLQEPLRMVSSYVQLLARRYEGKLDDEADQFISFATDGAKRMSQLINDLLSYSRVGRGEVQEQLVDCQKVLEHVLNNLNSKNTEAKVEITHDPLPIVKANELQITQVLQNLIDNAIKFRTQEHPRIHISAREDGNQWRFSVADNGIGIDAAYQERIFVIFQRLNAREDFPGTGIGLAICKKIVEQHKGKIWVEPNPETGTIVYFTWP